jgi:hypothetical protein
MSTGLCIRARLLSGRKFVPNESGFSPCGTRPVPNFPQLIKPAAFTCFVGRTTLSTRPHTCPYKGRPL